MMYYILSIKHSLSHEPYLTWWGPNNEGYTFLLEAAGKYTIEEIAYKPWYYNNGTETLAVPCEVIDKMTLKTPKNQDQGTVVYRRRLKQLIKTYKKGSVK